MMLSILTRKGRIACQNIYSRRSIWMLDLKVLKNGPWVSSSKYALQRALLSELGLKLGVHLGMILPRKAGFAINRLNSALRLTKWNFSSWSPSRGFFKSMVLISAPGSIAFRMCLSRLRRVLNGIDDGSKLACNGALTTLMHSVRQMTSFLRI